MRILVKTLLLLFALLLTAPGVAQAETAHDADRQHMADSVLAEHHEKPQAVLDNASELIRVCSTRPVRVTPSSHYTPGQRIVVRQQQLFHTQKTSYLQYRGRCTLFSRPILTVPPCRHYVLALGQLLC